MAATTTTLDRFAPVPEVSIDQLTLKSGGLTHREPTLLEPAIGMAT